MEHILIFIKKCSIEIILIIASAVISLFVFFQYSNFSNSPEILSIESPALNTQEDIETYSVDISGAVERPNVYKVQKGSIIKDVIDKAGGFTKETDKEYVSKHFNLAKILSDQEKIYIPTKEDTKNEDFINNISSNSSQPTANESNSSNNIEMSLQISLNNASEVELDSLPGIGPATAKKIIDNRPYSNVDELLSKKLVKSNVFEEIKVMVKL